MVQMFDAPDIVALPHVYCIDYAHPTEMTPAGCSYIWSSTGLPQAYGACTDNTGAVHVESTGVIRRPGTGYEDATASSPVSVLMRVQMIRVQPEGVLGEFGLSRVEVMMSSTATSDFTISVQILPGYPGATTSTVTKAFVAGEATQFYTRPPNCGRIPRFRLTLTETVGTGFSAEFTGLALEYYSRGRAAHLNTNQVV
jgi:hypothetical protein